MDDHRVVFVKAHFAPKFRERIVKRATGRMTKGFLGQEKEEKVKEAIMVEDGHSDCEIDGARLAKDVENSIRDLTHIGFAVGAIVPITSGSYRYDYREGSISSRERVFGNTEAVSGSSGYSYGYGFSYTEGVLIVALKPA